MRYVVASLQIAIENGIKQIGHLVKEEEIILNEKEVMYMPSAQENFEKGVAILKGEIYTNTSINQLISEGGWNYGG